MSRSARSNSASHEGLRVNITRDQLNTIKDPFSTAEQKFEIVQLVEKVNPGYCLKSYFLRCLESPISLDRLRPLAVECAQQLPGQGIWETFTERTLATLRLPAETDLPVSFRSEGLSPMSGSGSSNSASHQGACLEIPLDQILQKLKVARQLEAQHPDRGYMKSYFLCWLHSPNISLAQLRLLAGECEQQHHPGQGIWQAFTEWTLTALGLPAEMVLPFPTEDHGVRSNLETSFLSKALGGADTDTESGSTRGRRRRRRRRRRRAFLRSEATGGELLSRNSPGMKVGPLDVEDDDDAVAAAKNNRNNEVPLNKQMIRVDYWAQWIEEAQAMCVADLKVRVQTLLGGDNNHCSGNGLSGLGKRDLVLTYATAQYHNLGNRIPNCVLHLSMPQRPHWERLHQQIFGGGDATAMNYMRELIRTYGVTIHYDSDKLRTDGEFRDLYIYFRMQAELQQKCEMTAFESQVLKVQQEKSAFRLRQMLRDDHHWDRTEFLETHTDLARAVVYARQQKQPLCVAFGDDVDHNIDAVPEAIPAKDPAKSGAWVLTPLFGGGGGGGGGESNNNNHKKASNNNQAYELTYAWTDGTAIHKSKVYTTLNGASDVIVPAGAGSVWVYYQTKQGGAIDASNNNNNNLCYAVDQWRCQVADLCIPMYQNLPKTTQLVTNGANGLWMLVPEPATTNNSRRSNRSKNNNSSGSSKLILYDGDHRDGRVVEQRVPSRKGVRLLLDVASGGVWVYIPQSKERQKQQQANNKALITAGLWHISITGEAVRVSFSSSVSDNGNDDQEDTQVLSLDSCLLASDSARAGVLVLGPTRSDKGKSSMLYHVTWNAKEQAMAKRHQRVDAKFENVQSILDDGAGGALLHYRKFKDMGWKLTRAVFGEFELVEQYKCPKNAKIVSTGQGAVWVLKKTGRGHNWGLQYLHETNSVEESTKKYVVNSILCGAYKQDNNS